MSLSHRVPHGSTSVESVFTENVIELVKEKYRKCTVCVTPAAIKKTESHCLSCKKCHSITNKFFCKVCKRCDDREHGWCKICEKCSYSDFFHCENCKRCVGLNLETNKCYNCGK